MISITPFFHVYHKYVFIMANISKIRLSGTTYSIQDENATKTVELTQAEYDALPATAKTSNSLFVITDAQGADLSNYYTKSETSGATEISTALASKADTATTYTKTETDNAITAATSIKQDTLVSGTNIKTINNQSILGEGNIEIQGGGGSSYTAGDGIDITNDVISVTGKVDTSAFTAHTADTVIHVTSDEKAAWNGKQDTLVSGTNIKTINGETLLGEGNITIEGGGSSTNVVQTTGTSTTDVMSQDAVTNAFNEYTVRKDSDNGIVRYWSWKSPNYPYGQNSIYNFAINGRCPLSKENVVNSSIWEFSLVETSAITTSVTSSSTDSQVPSAKAVYDQFGGLKLVKLTQSEYDSLTTKNSSTLYIING